MMPLIFKVTSHTNHVGPGSTFVVIKGMKEDGITYAIDALKKGAIKIVLQEGTPVSWELAKALEDHGAELEFVETPRLALAELSARAYGYPAKELKIIAITGTKGKTSTSFLVEHILRTAGFKTALLSTVENRIGDEIIPAELTTPQPDFLHAFFDQCKKRGVQFVIMEAAAQALTLHRLATLEFDGVAFTNFSLEHSEFYSTQEEYYKAKCSLFAQCKDDATVVLNADDAKVMNCKQLLNNTATVSLQGKGTSNGTVIQSNLEALKVNIHSGECVYRCETSMLLGAFSAYNLMTAIALVEKYGIEKTVIESAIKLFSGVPGRLKRFDLPNRAVAFIDNAHTPSSFEAIMTSLRPLTDHFIVVFGAGGDRDPVKRPLMGQIAAHYADQVFITTDNPRSEDPALICEAIYAGVIEDDRSKVHVELDRERAIRQAYARSKPGTIIALLGKGPVEYQHVKDVKLPFSEVEILRSLEK